MKRLSLLEVANNDTMLFWSVMVVVVKVVVMFYVRFGAGEED